MGTDDSASITVFASDGLKARVEKTDATTGTIVITAPSAIVERSTVAVILSDGYGRTYTKAINFIYEGIADIENGVLIITTAEPLTFSSEGGKLTVPIQTNLNYYVEVESASSSWLSYVPGTKANALRDEELTLSATANTGTLRHGFVYLMNVADKSILQTICITQEADADYLAQTVDLPDENFKAFILAAYDTNADGSLSLEEALKIKSLNISSRNIANLSGIEFFTNLEILNCNNNSLTSLDLSKNTALRSLTCSSNYQLESLDIASNVLLETLDCQSTKLETLDLSSNVSLISVDCSSNTTLKHLTLGKLVNLRSLYCASTSVATLNLSQCPKLNTLDCSKTQMSEIDLSANKELGSFSFSDCSWTLIDLGSNPNIKTLILSCYSSIGLTIKGEFLESIEFTSNPSLGYIDCRNCPNLGHFNNTSTRYDCSIPIYNFKGLKNLKTISIRNSGTADVIIDDTGAIESFYYSNSTGSSLKNLDLSKNPHVKELYISCQNISGNIDISGLDELEKLSLSCYVVLPGLSSQVLKSLYLNRCNNTSIDLSKLSGLQDLTLTGLTNLTSLALPSSSVLKSISLSDLVLLSSIDFSGHSSLKTVSISNASKLSKLTLPSNSALNSLSLSKMELLSSLDLSAQSELTSFSCSEGRCADNLDFSNNLNLSSLELRNVWGLKSLNLGDNKNISSVSINNDNIGGSLNVKFKGNYITNITTYSVLPDVSECPALATAWIYNTAAETMDFRNNTELSYISISGKQLASINFAGCSLLKRVDCSDNSKLKSLDLTGCVNLDVLNCGSCSLESLDLSSCTLITTLNCYSNKLSSLNVTECNKLTELSCFANQLKTLDVSGNLKLTYLRCSDMGESLKTVYVSAEQSIYGITYSRSSYYIPDTTEIIVK